MTPESEKYIGIKYKKELVSRNLPMPIKGVFSFFSEAGKKLKTHGLTTGRAGNLSTLIDAKIIITAAGSDLSNLAHDELILIEKAEITKNKIKYYGAQEPSSEAFLHSLIYSNFTGINSIIHVHPIITFDLKSLFGKIPITKEEKPYGTLELARIAIETLKDSDGVIFLKNHGFVAIGNHLTSTLEILLTKTKL